MKATWVAATCAAGLLGGCAGKFYGPPNEYGTAPAAWIANHTLVRHNPYNPVISPSDQARGGFVAVLREACQPAIDLAEKQGWSEPPPPAPPKPDDDPTAYKFWAVRHEATRLCADAITIHAIDQCVSKAGGQNYFTAKANVVLGVILSAANAGAAAAAIAHPGDNNAVSVALASNLASGANNARGFAPATVTLKTGDFTASEQAYTATAGFDINDVKAIRDKVPRFDREHETEAQYLEKLSGPGYEKVRSDRSILRYSRLHDAVYAVCPVAAY